MTQDEIIRMAVECQLLNASNRVGLYAQALERFAVLVAEREREKHSSPSWETVDDAIAAERESIARMFDSSPKLMPYAQNAEGGCLTCGFSAEYAAAAIRARGEQ